MGGFGSYVSDRQPARARRGRPRASLAHPASGPCQPSLVLATGHASGNTARRSIAAARGLGEGCCAITLVRLADSGPVAVDPGADNPWFRVPSIQALTKTPGSQSASQGQPRPSLCSWVSARHWALPGSRSSSCRGLRVAAPARCADSSSAASTAVRSVASRMTPGGWVQGEPGSANVGVRALWSRMHGGRGPGKFGLLPPALLHVVARCAAARWASGCPANRSWTHARR